MTPPPAVTTVLGLSSGTLVRRGLLVLAGGAAGSLCRYLVALWTAQQFGLDFPWGTLIVNVAGSFLIGAIATFADENGSIGPDTRALLVVGVLGGLTTFSSFAIDLLRLVEARELLRTTAYLCASLTISLLAAVGGIALARHLR
jgi:CrcB protein